MATPQVNKENKMSFKDLVGKRMHKQVKFMGEDIKIYKLTVAEVMAIQDVAKGSSNDDDEGIRVLKTVIGQAVDGAEELTEEDFRKFPMDELSKLSKEILKFSGLGDDSGK